MKIEIKIVSNKNELKKFIYLPAKIHKEHKLWAPPIYMDEFRYFNPNKNLNHKYSDTVLALAYKGDEIVGRVMGIVNRKFNEMKNENNSRFSFLECYEDKDVFNALLDFIEKWGKEKGTTKIIGPYGFTDQDPEGFIIEGYEHGPTIATYYNFEFMPKFLEERGYIKEVDYVTYQVPVWIPEFYIKISERVLRNKDFAVVEFTKRKELKSYIEPILSLMNETYQNIYGYSPLDEKEMHQLAKQYIPILDPRFVKVVTHKNVVVGFIIGIPDMMAGIRDAKGKLFPFGIFKILRSAKKTKQLDLLLGGIKEGFQNKGIDVLLGHATMASALKHGFTKLDSHHELETNLKMRAEMEKANGKIYKRFRVYQKFL